MTIYGLPKKLSLTNDPFNNPQLVVKNRNFKLIIKNNGQKIVNGQL